MLLEQAKADELSKFPTQGEEVRGKFKARTSAKITCTLIIYDKKNFCWQIRCIHDDAPCFLTIHGILMPSERKG